MSSEPEFEFTAEQEAHVHAVREMLAEVYRQAVHNGEAVETRTPLAELIEKEEREDSDYYAARIEGLRGFLRFAFQRGPDPAAVTQFIYVVTRAVAQELLLGMSGEQVSVIFGQGRAAESARMVALNKRLGAAGFKHTSFRHQKKSGARAKMSRAQLGNTNRKQGARKRAAA